MSLAKYKYDVKGIDCAHCAKEVEENIAALEGVEDVSLIYGEEVSHLEYVCAHGEAKEIAEKVKAVILEEEESAEMTALGHEHLHEEHARHEHEEHHEHHHQTAKYKYDVKGIDCAHCAKEVEENIAALEGVEDVSLVYGEEVSHLEYVCAHGEAKEIAEKVKAVILEEEESAEMIALGHEHLHEEHARHEHEEHHEHEHGEVRTVNYIVEGIDCAACAKELEEEIGKLHGVSNCTLEFGIKSRLQYDVEVHHMQEADAKMRKIIADDQENPVITRVTSGREKTYKYRIHNIDCAPCAIRLADKTAEIEGVSEASADFMNEALTFTCLPKERKRIEQEMIQMIKEEEPEVEVSVFEEAQTHEEESEDRTMLIRLIIGAVLFVIGLFLEGIPQILVSLAAYMILGYDVLVKAVRNLGRGQLFDEHFLMTVATLAAIYLKDYKEAAGVMLFYQVGEYFQDMAVARSRKSIGELMDIRPDHAYVLRNGQAEETDPEEVEIGEIVRIRPGERVPLDGIVVKGASSLDTASLTGESKPRDVDVNDEVMSGSVNQTGVLEVRVTKAYGESTVSRILELVENNDANKAEHEKFITRFSRYYTPIVVFAAIAVAVIVGIVTGDVNDGIYRACTFLVISCPCALVISIPLSFFAGIGGLSSRGILVKGANVIDVLAKVDQVVMDKTGTLTSGEFAVEEVLGTEKPDEVIRSAAYAEHFSNHPIAQGISNAYGREITDEEVGEVEEIAGRGVKAVVNGQEILAGNYKLMMDHGVACKEENTTGTLVYVAVDDVYQGCLVLRDQLKKDAESGVRKLRENHRKTVIISGDSQEVVDEIGKKLGVDQAVGECLPQDKVSLFGKLKESGSVTAFVGDGVNDAPVLAAADVGFAMGALGSDAAIEAADVVLMDDSVEKIALTISSAARILKVANENIYFAIAVKVLTLVLGAFGIANMWMAIFADTGVAMLCVLNSMRLLRIARKTA